ncbi:MAG: helix-turn-helix domain-containing protein [Rubrimonas sp.]|uniref:RodZ domain-containing protein n=1 Tax=Rubrimonas sp. TaxID=2036015 RepID=UPI002FDCBF1A
MADTVGLRGYDSYRVTLGDEMRGERASLGKSLLDVQRDLRIRAAHIDAIENCDPDGIPYKGFVSGYVRAYARYLGMDEDVVLERFCAESGFAPSAAAPSGRRATGAKAPGTVAGRRDDLDAVIAGSRLAAASRAESMSVDFGSTLRGLGSLAVLAALIGGLGYGGWALLQNIQRVDFAPISQPPAALAEAPDLGGARIAQAGLARGGVGAAPAIDAEALARLYADQERDPPRLALRDGPIAALDPARAGVYAPPPEVEATAEADVESDAQPDAAALAADAEVVAGAPEAEIVAAEAGLSPETRGLSLVFAEEAWVRVRDASGAVLHEGLMPAGQAWRAPVRTEGLTLRAGNAGGVFVEIDGVRFGPVGRSGAVVSNLSLAPEAVKAAFAPVPRGPSAGGPVRSASAVAQ